MSERRKSGWPFWIVSGLLLLPRFSISAAEPIPANTRGPAEGQIESRRSADEIVADIESALAKSRGSLPAEKFVQTHQQIAALVDELRRAHPEDPRVATFLPERWLSLKLNEGWVSGMNRVDSRRQLHAEIRTVLDTTKNAELMKEAEFLETMLRFQEPIDGPDAASLAEEFARKWPDDSRCSELFYNAAQKLNEAWFIRLAFVVSGTSIALIAWKRPARPSKLVVLLGLLSVLVLAVVLITFQLLPDGQQARRVIEIGAVLSLYAWEGIQGIVWAGRVGVAVVLSGIAALIAVRVRRRRSGDSVPESSAVREWIVGFVAAFALCSVLDATLIARDSAALKQRIVAEYPDSFRGRMLQGQARQHERIGQPFELEFNDAISGRSVSMKDLRGKIVVVDFWATWCGPCVHEIPELKRLYAQYHDQGVELIGVSQDLPEEDGGLEALKAFVAKEQIPWPQFYSGGRDRRLMLEGASANDFSEAWGIEGVPTVFVIDADGNLYSTEARGQLETLIPRLLSRQQKR